LGFENVSGFKSDGQLDACLEGNPTP
jgi:hypothetical protein